MPRFDKKATKIAYKILGKPHNLRKDVKSKRDEKINKRLVFEETQRAR